MNRVIDQLKLIFLAAFVAISGGVLIYYVYWQRPAERCEAEQRKWWDPSGRVCATPILISDITGRVITDKAEAAARPATDPAPTEP